MTFRAWVVSIVMVFLCLPTLVAAQGLVPCGNSGQDPCQTCHVVDLINNVAGWLVGVLSAIAAVMFVVAGYRLVTSGGNQAALTGAKSLMTNAAIGLVIVMSGWLIVDTVMKGLLTDTDSDFGPWNGIACQIQPVSDTRPGTVALPSLALTGYPTNGPRGTAYNSSGVSAADLQAVAQLSASEADALLEQYGTEQGLSPEQITNMQALMRVESGGCRNLQSPAGAFGCMQILPSTARQYDPALRGLTEQQIAQRLLDTEYNIQLGTQIYADLYNDFGGDEITVFAAYNGGPGAVGPSRDCPGLKKYECPWDSPGCYGTGRTDCERNTGYQETRNYVIKVPTVADQLQ